MMGKNLDAINVRNFEKVGINMYLAVYWEMTGKVVIVRYYICLWRKLYFAEDMENTIVNWAVRFHCLLMNCHF